MRLALLIVVLVATEAGAQMFPDTSRYAGSLSFGSFEYDLAAEGKSRMLALRVERPISRFVLAEGGLVWATQRSLSNDTTHFFAAEAHIQGQYPIGPFAPFVGVGGGVALHRRDQVNTVTGQGHITDPTVSAATGFRFWFTPLFGARAEGRFRALGGDFTGHSREWTFGALLRF